MDFRAKVLLQQLRDKVHTISITTKKDEQPIMKSVFDEYEGKEDDIEKGGVHKYYYTKEEWDKEFTRLLSNQLAGNKEKGFDVKQNANDFYDELYSEVISWFERAQKQGGDSSTEGITKVTRPLGDVSTKNGESDLSYDIEMKLDAIDPTDPMSYNKLKQVMSTVKGMINRNADKLPKVKKSPMNSPIAKKMKQHGLPTQAIDELSMYSNKKDLSDIKDIDIVPDPQVDGVYALQLHRGKSKIHLLWRDGGFDEVEFTQWPPRVRY